MLMFVNQCLKYWLSSPKSRLNTDEEKDTLSQDIIQNNGGTGPSKKTDNWLIFNNCFTAR